MSIQPFQGRQMVVLEKRKEDGALDLFSDEERPLVRREEVRRLPVRSPMEKYEYAMFEWNYGRLSDGLYNARAFVLFLNEKDKEGWEFISDQGTIFPPGWAFFRRLKKVKMEKKPPRRRTQETDVDAQIEAAGATIQAHLDREDSRAVRKKNAGIRTAEE
jgi:hypothetical protein